MTQALNAPANAYLRTRVLTASPEELRLMLLDGAIKFARQGREGIAAKQYEQMFNGLSQCREIVFELLNTIRPEHNPALAQNARALYAFLYRTLVEASHEKDAVKADKAIEILEFERETWSLLMQQLASERGVRPAENAGAISVQG